MFDLTVEIKNKVTSNESPVEQLLDQDIEVKSSPGNEATEESYEVKL